MGGMLQRFMREAGKREQPPSKPKEPEMIDLSTPTLWLLFVFTLIAGTGLGILLSGALGLTCR